jgi:hypothetical protein
MPAGQYLREGLKTVQWGTVLLYGAGAGLIMPIALTQNSIFSVVAGIVPVTIGLLLARQAKGFYGLIGFLTGLVGALTSTAFLGVWIFAFGNTDAVMALAPDSTSAVSTWLTASGFISFSLIAFCTFGASTSGRMEERNREAQQRVSQRGGTLERAGVIREAGDIRGLTLAQLGWVVNKLFEKKGFVRDDYKFVDKDRFLDLWMTHDGNKYHIRCSIADKVNPGAIESLLQEMKREGITRGVIVSSTEFSPAAQKAIKEKPVVLMDAVTLLELVK